MRINKVSYRDQLIQDYSVIIDVRTPSEFIEDHIPNSINYPVLSNKQRHEIGISYKENSFLAKKNGAELISFNISKIIKKIEFDKKDKVLIYCWRGGLRSLSLYLVLKQIGYDVYLLDGGYKSFRKRVVEYLDKEAPKFKFNQIMGITGVGKTLFLKELSKTKQVIDFEGLANHKGSILGDIPNKAQPSQKFYETCIYQKLNEFNNNNNNLYIQLKKKNNLGVTGYITKNGLSGILTQSFVSKRHYDIFGFYFPESIINWFN